MDKENRVEKGRGEEHMKINFEYFQIQKCMLQTVRAEKVYEKNGVICLQARTKYLRKTLASM